MAPQQPRKWISLLPWLVAIAVMLFYGRCILALQSPPPIKGTEPGGLDDNDTIDESQGWPVVYSYRHQCWSGTYLIYETVNKRPAAFWFTMITNAVFLAAMFVTAFITASISWRRPRFSLAGLSTAMTIFPLAYLVFWFFIAMHERIVDSPEFLVDEWRFTSSFEIFVFAVGILATAFMLAWMLWRGITRFTAPRRDASAN